METSADISHLPLPPGSSGLPLLGETLAFIQNTGKFVEDRRLLHGDVFRSHVLGDPIVFLLGPEANRWIFAGENKYLRNRWHLAARKLLGKQSVAMLNGGDHLDRRRLLAPHFTYAAMRHFVPRIEAIVQRHCEQWLSGTQPFKAVDAVRALVFEVAIVLMMGESQVDPAYMSRLFKQWVAGLFAAVPVDLPFTAFGRGVAAEKELRAYIDSLVAEREKRTEQPPDTLGSLLSARDEQGRPLSRDAIIDELELLLFAGHDTTVTATSNLMMLLAQYPEVLERCRREQQELAEQGPLTLESLRAMPYLHQVIQEVMRFIPPIAGAFRVTTEDVSYGGYRIPKGWQVSLNIRAAHKGAPWTSPERFDPERMGPDRCEQKPQGAYIPFGGGPRVCVGQHFAMVEMAAVAALLLRDYQWELVPGQDLSPIPFPIPLPRDGLLVRFSRR
ncbi:cytochrome P450 [Archangium lansingense]|uniref:Cytochrome P450 n=1 Tax=Archangium lansingense TaxID=2995310 RepID=A0ABT4A8X4_9BACT|nr:cytochrome P450 [Archangium lansinium]MCY1078106.1 cytochrome P450 [Archangium lansinium]